MKKRSWFYRYLINFVITFLFWTLLDVVFGRTSSEMVLLVVAFIVTWCQAQDERRKEARQ